MIRRLFSIYGTPSYIERFKTKRVMLYEMEDNTFVEYSDGQYYNLTCDDNYVIMDRIKFKGCPEKIINKVRYFLPITHELIAKIDYCDDYDIDTIIRVDFLNRQDADNFRVPDWFGEEIIPDLKKLKAKKKSMINNKYKTNERLG